jgi:hypothetical protein
MTGFFGNVKGHGKDAILWIDHHPRTGWYVAVVVTLDLLLNILQVVH